MNLCSSVESLTKKNSQLKVEVKTEKEKNKYFQSIVASQQAEVTRLKGSLLVLEGEKVERTKVTQCLTENHSHVLSVNESQKKEIEMLKTKISRLMLGEEMLSVDEKSVKFLTGLPNYDTFQLVMKYVMKENLPSSYCSLNPCQEMLLMLMKL